MNMKNLGKIKIFTIVFFLIAIIYVLFLLPIKYSSTKWQKNNSIRFRMTSNIIKSKILIGKFNYEIKKFMGNPDTIMNNYLYYIKEYRNNSIDLNYGVRFKFSNDGDKSKLIKDKIEIWPKNKGIIESIQNHKSRFNSTAWRNGNNRGKMINSLINKLKNDKNNLDKKQIRDMLGNPDKSKYFYLYYYKNIFNWRKLYIDFTDNGIATNVGVSRID